MSTSTLLNNTGSALPLNLSSDIAKNALGLRGALYGTTKFDPADYVSSSLNSVENPDGVQSIMLGSQAPIADTDYTKWMDGLFDSKTGSKFGEVTGGLASLYGIYAGMQGLDMAKEANKRAGAQFAAAQKEDARKEAQRQNWGKGLAMAVGAPVPATTKL